MATGQMTKIEVTWQGTAGAPFYTRLFFDSATSTAQGNLDAVRSCIQTMASRIANNLTAFYNNEVEKVDPITGQTVDVETVTARSSTVGTASDAQLPYANQAMLRWETGTFLNGRRFRGRTFLPGLTVAANSDGEVASAYRTAAESTFDDLLAQNVVVYSPTARMWRAANAVVCPPKIAVLRSRRD